MEHDIRYTRVAFVPAELPWFTAGLEAGVEKETIKSFVGSRVDIHATHRPGLSLFVSAKQKETEYNRAATHLYVDGYTKPLFGNVTVIRFADDGSIVDLTDADIKWLESRNGRNHANF